MSMLDDILHAFRVSRAGVTNDSAPTVTPVANTWRALPTVTGDSIAAYVVDATDDWTANTDTGILTYTGVARKFALYAALAVSSAGSAAARIDVAASIGGAGIGTTSAQARSMSSHSLLGARIPSTLTLLLDLATHDTLQLILRSTLTDNLVIGPTQIVLVPVS